MVVITPRDPDDLFAIFDDAEDSSSKKNADNNNDKTQADAVNTAVGHRKTRSLVGFDPLLTSTTTDSKDTTIASSKQRQRRHRTSKTACVSDLSDIATQLALENPTKEQESRITLGVTTEDSTRVAKKKTHRKTQSLTMLPLRRTSSAHQPQPPPRHPLTPPRRAFTPKTSPKTPPQTLAPPNSTLSPSLLLRRPSLGSKRTQETKENIDIPTLAKQSPTSFLKDATTMAPRTSEQDPSPYQTELPEARDLDMQAKLCALLEHTGFDFNVLKGVSRSALQLYLEDQYSIADLGPEQKPVVQAFLESSGSSSTIEVEGFFAFMGVGEVLVVSTQSRSTFIVVYRGTTEQQAKPVRAKRNAVPLEKDNPVLVYPVFRDTYFDLEPQVYALLDTLVEENPFSHVVFTGVSFGGALATLGAVRFSMARPTLRFSCHTFGSPKVGTQEFRQLVNSLPNLKVMRIELAADPIPSSPADAKYQHVGHSLVIQASSSVMAYRFDKKKPNASNFLQHRKCDVQTYVRALEPFATNQQPWVELYFGEDVGKGVRGKNNERRKMV